VENTTSGTAPGRSTTTARNTGRNTGPKKAPAQYILIINDLRRLCKKPSFTMQNTAYYNTKGYLSDNER
jgi:hypothetical protein